MTSRFWRQAVIIHRSFAWALLGLGSMVPTSALAAEEAEPVESETVTAPATQTPDATPAAPTPAPPPEPAMPTRSTPMPAPEPAVLAAPLPAPRTFTYGDESTRWGVWLDLDHLFLTRDDDKRMTDAKGISGGGLSLSYDLLRLAPKAVLSVDAGWANEKSSGAWTNGAATDVASNQLRVGAAVRYGLLSWLYPYAHVSAGVGRSRMEVRTGSDGALTDKQGFAQGALGGGLSIRSPSMALGKGANPWRLGLSLNVEGGYIVGSKTAFTVKGPGAADGEKEPIAVTGVSVGDVSRSRPYLRISMGVLF
jgi:hypothetical protein